MAMAVRSTSAAFPGPALRARMSATGGEARERRRTASSMESSSKGFMLCFRPVFSRAVWVLLMWGLSCGEV